MIISTDIDVICQGVHTLVQRQIEKEVPLLSPVLPDRDTVSDAFGVQCLADVNGTAAIVKEIIFNRTRRDSVYQHFTADFGLGTGILLAAGIMSGVRSGATHICGVGFDSQEKSIQNAARVLETFAIPSVQTRLYQADITYPIIYQGILREPLHMDCAISETFGLSTPFIAVENNELQFNEDAGLSMALAKNIDPYPYVLANLLRLQNFTHGIETEQTWMFPNIFNGDYKPNKNESQIRLQTSADPKLMPLPNVGNDFLRFEGFGQIRRWH